MIKWSNRIGTYIAVAWCVNELTERRIETHCPYCALQCGIVIVDGGDGGLSVTGNERFDVNKGSLCVKGWTSIDALNHKDRLLSPLKRNARGVLIPVEWDEAFETIAGAIKQAQSLYGNDAVGILGGGALTNEKSYLLGKFARVGLKTSNIDYNGRFCMSSAATAGIRAFGIDRGLPFPIEDIPKSEIILLVGANPAETMPPLLKYFVDQRNNGGQLITVDPRFTMTAQIADIHLLLTPGTDAVFAYGLLHILIRENLIDITYIADRTSGFDKVKAIAASFWPERVERITGIAESRLYDVAHRLAASNSAMILTARGAEQHSDGADTTSAFINLALALGLPGKADSGYGTITGQGNGQGGREHGQKADQLPGYRKINDPVARQHVAEVWNIPESELPQAGKSAYEMMINFGDEVRTLLTFGFNLVVSSPDAEIVKKKLSKLDFICVSDFFLSETAKYADVVLPSAMWAEESGTMTNLEGRILRRRFAVPPPVNVKTDVEVICELAHRLGKEQYFNYDLSEDIFEELRAATKGGAADYSAISYSRLDSGEVIHWPCNEKNLSGTPRLFSDKFETQNGRARFYPAHPLAKSEEPDQEYPYYLTTGRILTHYQSGNQTRRIQKLMEMSSSPYAEIHPTVAQRYGISDGDELNLVTRRGRSVFKAKITRNIRLDTIFIPFHWGGERSANNLTNPILDPTSKMPSFKVCAVRIETINENVECVDLSTL